MGSAPLKKHTPFNLLATELNVSFRLIQGLEWTGLPIGDLAPNTIAVGSIASSDFSQSFYCGTAMLRVNCVALDMGAQTTASTPACPNLHAPYHHHAPFRPPATKAVRIWG